MFRQAATVSRDSSTVIWKHVDICDYHFVDETLIQETFGLAKKRIHKHDIIFPLKKCLLAGVEMRCPNKPKEYLKAIAEDYDYGDVFVPNKICKDSVWTKAE